MLYPSIMTHVLNGLLLAFALIFMLFNLQKIKGFDVYRILVITLLFAAVIGIHSISHLGLEQQYNYIPFNL
jgi:hypothetical protein